MEIAWIDHYIIQDIPSSFRTFQEIVEYIANQWKPLFEDNIQPIKKGMYLATTDAGTIPSITFWEDALKTGPGFVLPGMFPWTLSNAPAACLARVLNIRGPNVTMIGKGEAVLATLDHAFLDLESNRIQKAFVVGLDFLEASEVKPQCSVLILSNTPNKNGIKLSNNTSSIIFPEKPSFWISEICKAIENQDEKSFGIEGDVGFSLMYR